MLSFFFPIYATHTHTRSVKQQKRKAVGTPSDSDNGAQSKNTLIGLSADK